MLQWASVGTNLQLPSHLWKEMLHYCTTADGLDLFCPIDTSLFVSLSLPGSLGVAFHILFLLPPVREASRASRSAVPQVMGLLSITKRSQPTISRAGAV